MISSDVPALSVVDLSKSYNGKFAATSIRFTVGTGEVVGLLGPNGAGKTTILESIAGLVRPDAGRIEVCGIDAQQHPATAKQKIGAVLQSTALQDKITPTEAIQVFSSLYRDTTPAETLLRRFGLEEFSHQSFSTLSGGQQQRVAVAA
jgi:ABC-2 type transport system ATP-binding protein